VEVVEAIHTSERIPGEMGPMFNRITAPIPIRAEWITTAQGAMLIRIPGSREL
jgi:hypothetical protein